MNNNFKILLDCLNTPLNSSDRLFNMFTPTINGGHGLTRYMYQRGTRKNKVVLVAHTDTAFHPWSRSDSPIPSLVMKDGVITNRTGLLGADDRAGVAMLKILENSGHSILLVDGEESGTIGSSFLAENNQELLDELNEHCFMIQLDRRGNSDFKCYDVGSKSFRTYVGKMTGYKEPDRRSFSDIVKLCDKICGVNLSVGYYNEHRDDECLIVSEWENTLDILTRWISKENLPRFLKESDSFESRGF